MDYILVRIWTRSTVLAMSPAEFTCSSARQQDLTDTQSCATGENCKELIDMKEKKKKKKKKKNDTLATRGEIIDLAEFSFGSNLVD